ncbi:MAG: flagellar motor switch protein FliN [bacterium]
MSEELETPNVEADESAPSELEARSASAKNLEVVLDIPVRLSMEVGNTKISIRKLLQLNKGSIVELTRTAGEPLDVLVNGTLVAQGEVVVVNDKFGVRLLDVISPEQRIQSIN